MILPLLLSTTFTQASNPPDIGGCQIFPANSIFNTPIDLLPVHPDSDTFVSLISATASYLHPDFGAFYYDSDVGYNVSMGIPFNVVPASQPLIDVDFSAGYYDQTDMNGGTTTTGLYPVPPQALVEGQPYAQPGDDRHCLIIREGECRLYEIYQANPTNAANTTWQGTSGAIFNLSSTATRPVGWTSADAAGLPILPLLVTYSDINGDGEINHAFRFTAPSDLIVNYVWPGSHLTSSCSKNCPVRPAMGQRFRLKSSYNPTSGFSARNLKVIRALQKYGMFLADGGSAWYLSGEHNPLFDGDEQGLKGIPASEFEAVDESCIEITETSYAIQACSEESTASPTTKATSSPNVPSHVPTKRPTTHVPTKRPTTHVPTKRPTTHVPTKRPTKPTKRPTKHRLHHG